ncbi:MAG: tetratricopeptide repeat protein [Candidatus Kapabacteria bacterium]|nr:tetratricopeptide repeat protein [Candidatus Kapabacteria bacterium]
MTPEEIQQALEKLINLFHSSQLNEAKIFAYELLENPTIQIMPESLADVYNVLGNIYRNFSDYPESLECYTKSLQINEEIGRKSGISGNLINIGTTFNNLNDFVKALDYLKKGLIISEEIGHKLFQANAMTVIGNVYGHLSDYHNHLEYNSKSLYIFEEIGNKEGIAMNLGNIGGVYLMIKDYPRALEYYEKALQICIELEKKMGIANSIGNIGNVYHNLSDYSKAIEFYTKSLHIYEEIGIKVGIARYNGNIGSVYLTKDTEFYDLKKAEVYLKKALLIAEVIEAKDVIKEVYENLHELRLNEERYKEALDYKLKSIELEKEIQSIEAKKQADNFHIQRKITEREIQIAEERGRLLERETILRNILPDSVTDRLVKGENPIADHFETASVLFMDLVGFTTLASIAPPKQLVYLLDAIFQKADEVVETFGLEKIKTIGDGYLAVANVTTPLEEHQKATALSALQLLETMKDFEVNIPSDLGDTEWIKNMTEIEIRIGIHSGEVVAGIIGKNKYTYDLWGDAVNIASRMESNSEAGRIHISERFAKSIEHHPEFSLIPRGEINIKGKGKMNTYWLEKAE